MQNAGSQWESNPRATDFSALTTDLWQPDNHQHYQNPLCILHQWYWMLQSHTSQPLCIYVSIQTITRPHDLHHFLIQNTWQPLAGKNVWNSLFHLSDQPTFYALDFWEAAHTLIQQKTKNVHILFLYYYCSMDHSVLNLSLKFSLNAFTKQ